jgi:tetratricopeptide (TPR) repeat protein
MRFVRNDYEEKRRRRNRFIASFAALVVVALGFSLLLKKSNKGGDESIQETPVAVETRETPVSTGKVKDLPTLFSQTRKSIVLIKTFNANNEMIGQGSGFFIGREGIMVSNRHVFRNAHHAEVQGVSGKFAVQKVLEAHSDYDLVRLQVDTRKKIITPLKTNKVLPKVGERVLVIGNPMGLESTVSDGIVSAIRELEPFGTVIQITSPISPGSSGSPVLNMKGEVVGVATFQMRKGQNLNFAIPISRLNKLRKVEGGEMSTINFEDTELVQAIDNAFDQGMILFSRKQYQGAIAFFRKAVKKDPQNAEAFMHLGICYRETGATNAVEAFKSAVDLDPDYAEAYYHLGITYIRLNQPQEAVEALREALRIQPGYDEALLQLGVAYAMNKQYRPAVNALEKSLDIFPDAKGYFYLGFSYQQLRQHSKAIRALNEAIEMDRDMLHAYLALGISYIQVEYWTKGIKVLNKAVLIAPQDPQVHYILGLLHLGNNDTASAEHEYQILVRLKGGSKLATQLSRAISSRRNRR